MREMTAGTPCGVPETPRSAAGVLAHTRVYVHAHTCAYMRSLPGMPADVRALRNTFIRLELWAAWASAHVVASWLPRAPSRPTPGPGLGLAWQREADLQAGRLGLTVQERVGCSARGQLLALPRPPPPWPACPQPRGARGC